jgi:catechol 2,3-dioxygenase-like lactoylglutathione lyase family enzyme
MLLLFDAAATRGDDGADAAGGSGSTGSGGVPAHGADGPGHVALDVPDADALDAWREHLGVAGVEIEHEETWPSGGRSLYFRDPSGNSIELITRGSWGF